MRQGQVNTILILNNCLTSFSTIVWSISVRKTDRIHNKKPDQFWWWLIFASTYWILAQPALDGRKAGPYPVGGVSW